MAIYGARFIIFACAAFLLTPLVDAAHIHGGYSMERHVTSPHFPHKTHKPSLFGGSTADHKHKGKHDERRTHDNMRIALPPLLRRYRVPDHYQDQPPHDHVDDRILRSTFARSRYRRESGSHRRRSSVYVPGEHGNTYIVSRTPPRRGGIGYVDTDKHTTSHAYSRRQSDPSSLASGRVDIMGASQSPSGTQRLASLTVDSTPIDLASGRDSAKAFPLNASTTNQTQFIMMLTDDSNASENSNKHVKLATEVFDAGSADMVLYCATYDANPGTPSALLMTPCTDTAQSESSNDDATRLCADDQNGASSTNSHQSQIFSYDPFSGMIEPILATEDASGGGNHSDSSASCAGAKVRRDTSNALSGSASPSGTSASTAPAAKPSQHAQNVTLVYVAGALEVPALSQSASTNTSTSAATTATTSAHINQAAVVTTTITTTVVATVTASGSATPAKAVASMPTSSPPVSTTTTSRAASTTPANADESLEVEVVGVTASATTSSPSTPVSGGAAALSSSSSDSSASQSLGAEAVASLVAHKMPHRKRAIAIASASVV